MRTSRTRRALAGAAVLVAATLAGCGADSPEPAPAEPAAGTRGTPTGADGLLAEHGLDGLPTAEVIDRLDSLPVAERPGDLIASVRPAELVVSTGAGEEQSLPIPEDRFYLSVAPYVDSTHDCFHHSLTTCQGELSGAEVQVRIVDETSGEVLVEETRTTFDNGFTGFWLPRDIEGTLRITHEGRTGEVPIATDEDAPTCLTTLQLT